MNYERKLGRESRLPALVEKAWAFAYGAVVALALIQLLIEFKS